MLDVRLLKVNPITQAGVTPTCQMRWEVSMLYIFIYHVALLKLLRFDMCVYFTSNFQAQLWHPRSLLHSCVRFQLFASWNVTSKLFNYYKEYCYVKVR